LPRSRVVILQTPEGATLADGDLIQTSSGTRVTTRLVLRFKDGSRHEETTVLGFTPKPQLVQQEISPAGEEPFSIAGAWRKAIHYVVKVHVPGLTGVVASVFGKIPPDSHIWILGGEAPAFVAAETSLFSGGPQWRIELAIPKWPSAPSSSAKKDSKDVQAAKGAERAPAARAPRKKPRSGSK